MFSFHLISQLYSGHGESAVLIAELLLALFSELEASGFRLFALKQPVLVRYCYLPVWRVENHETRREGVTKCAARDYSNISTLQTRRLSMSSSETGFSSIFWNNPTDPIFLTNTLDVCKKTLLFLLFFMVEIFVLRCLMCLFTPTP